MAHFTKLLFCQKNKTYSCKCSVSLYCVGIVSAQAVVHVEFPAYALSIHMSYKIAKLDKQPFC